MKQLRYLVLLLVFSLTLRPASGRNIADLAHATANGNVKRYLYQSSWKMLLVLIY
jgi:hypothetical protein